MLAAGYIVGAEVLWRMMRAHVFWEFGKYAVSLLLLLAIFRRRTLAVRALAPICYFILLLPSTFLWFGQDWKAARNAISFNLSGPFCLAVCAAYFSAVRIDWPVARRLLLLVAAPMVGTATGALWMLATAGHIEFTTESNFLTSGGFGPVQVSQSLGLGILCCWMLVLVESRRSWIRLVALVLLLWFSVHALLTFSRTGAYVSVVAVLCTLPLLLRNRRTRARAIVVTAALALLMAFVVLPRLNAFTGGKLAQRFSDPSTTGRDRIAKWQLRVWLAHPLFGVGPGGAVYNRELGTYKSPHTEFTRLLAEHGVWGAVAMSVLAFSLRRRFRGVADGWPRLLRWTLLVWAVGCMLSTAMRLGGQSFALGLQWAYLVNNGPRDDHADRAA
jgi:O-antigen ligase